jgi:hypothetical protein
MGTESLGPADVHVGMPRARPEMGQCVPLGLRSDATGLTGRGERGFMIASSHNNELVDLFFLKHPISISPLASSSHIIRSNRGSLRASLSSISPALSQSQIDLVQLPGREQHTSPSTID